MKESDVDSPEPWIRQILAEFKKDVEESVPGLEKKLSRYQSVYEREVLHGRDQTKTIDENYAEGYREAIADMNNFIVLRPAIILYGLGMNGRQLSSWPAH